MTGSKTTNTIKKLTKRERRVLIIALVIVPFFYPFLLVWFAHGSLDKVYKEAIFLPKSFRSVAAPGDMCPKDLDTFKKVAHSALIQCVGALPDGSKDLLKSRHLLEDMEFLPIFGRGLILWGKIGEICPIPRGIWKRPEQECQHAGEKLHRAAANLEKALVSYEQTRIIMWVLLYLWLVAEIFGWIVVIHFARRFLRERAEAKASSQSSD